MQTIGDVLGTPKDVDHEVAGAEEQEVLGDRRVDLLLGEAKGLQENGCRNLGLAVYLDLQDWLAETCNRLTLVLDPLGQEL